MSDIERPMETHRQTSGKTLCEKHQQQPIKYLSLPFIALLRVYRYCLSPMLGPRCRFEPTCSAYAEQAIKEYGVFKGLYMSVRRLSKCHPWHKGGYDPVTSKHKNFHK